MAIAYVQSKSAAAASVTSLGVTLTTAVTAGNTLLVGGYDGNGVSQTDTVSDNVNAGNYTRDNTVDLTSDGDTVGVFSKLNVGSGSTTITIARSGSGGSLRIVAHEYSGLATSSALDQTATGHATSTSGTTSNVTTTQASELIFCVLGCAGADTVTSNSPFTQRENTGFPGGFASQDQVASSTGTFAANYTISPSDEYGAVIATYKAPSSGATGSAAITEGADTVAGTGSVGVSGSAAITEAHDTVTASGSVGVSGSAAITEGADTVAASGTAGAAGSAAITEGGDTVAASGSVGVSGSAAITEGSDIVAAAGAVGVSGSAAISEGSDTVAATGSVGVAGSAAIVEGADTVTASGTATTGAVGAAAIQEDLDTVTASGSVGVSGSASIAEGADIVAGVGVLPDIPSAGSNAGGGGGGGRWSGKFEFSSTKRELDRIAEVTAAAVPRGTLSLPRNRPSLPENASVILADSLKPAIPLVELDDDEEAFALLSLAEDHIRGLVIERLSDLMKNGDLK